jgi:hypothetical protein
MKRPGLFLCLTLVAFSSHPSPLRVADPASPPEGFVYVDGDSLMLDGSRFEMKGFNYFPRDYGWTSMADWDWQAVDRELALAEALGANTIRTGINYMYSTGNPAWQKNIFTHNRITPESMAALEQLLSLADRHGMKVVLWLNDGLPWELLAPTRFGVVEGYLEGLIPSFADDPRIAAWDLATDLDGTMLLPPPTGGYRTQPWMSRDGMLAYLTNMSRAVKSLDPNHPVTIGFCWPSSSLLTQDITDFLMFQFLGADYPQVLQGPGPGEAEEYGKWWDVESDRATVAASVEAKLKSIQGQMDRPMPVVLAEYGVYSGAASSETMQAAVYDVVLDVAFLRLKIAGAMNWALTDFTWPPKAYTSVPADAPQAGPEEQSFGVYRLDYSPKPAATMAAAYYASSPTLTLASQPDELKFVFSRSFVPGSGDPRSLTAAFDWIRFLDDAGGELTKLDLGAPSARPYLASGFYPDEGPWTDQAANFVWAGSAGDTAVVRMPFPEGTRVVEVRLLAGVRGMSVETWIDDQLVSTLAPTEDWSIQSVTLPTQGPLEAGDVVPVRGWFNLPISNGAVALETSSDGATWVQTDEAAPEDGRILFHLRLAGPETSYARLSWGGDGSYGPAVSQPVRFGLQVPATSTSAPRPTASLEPSPTPAPAAVPRSGPLTSPITVGSVILLVVAGTSAGVILFRRRH